jgi:hypothetical protein
MTFKECLSNLGPLSSCLSHTSRACGVPVVVDNSFFMYYIQLADSKYFKGRHMIFLRVPVKQSKKKKEKKDNNFLNYIES